MKVGWVALTLMLASCGLPQDIEGTSERIAARHTIRVGIDGTADPAATRFLAELARRTDARMLIESASLERLIERLDADRIDMLIAPVRADALLKAEIALSPALEGKASEDRPVAVRAGVRNGENRWLITVEQAARTAAGA